MAGIYARQIANALRQIKTKGQLVMWYKHQDQVTVADNTKPWKTSASDPQPDPIAVYIVFITPKNQLANQIVHLMQNTSVPQGAPAGLMGAVDFTPTIDDKVVRSGETLRVKGITPLAPNGTPILYTLTFA